MNRLPMLPALRARRRLRALHRAGGRWGAWAAALSGRSRRDLLPVTTARTWRRSLRPGGRPPGVVGHPAIGALRRGVAPPVHPSIGAPAPGARTDSLLVPRPGSVVTTHRSIVTLRRAGRSGADVPAGSHGTAGRPWTPPGAAVPAPLLRTAAADAPPRRVERVAAFAASPLRAPHRVEVAPRNAADPAPGLPGETAGRPGVRPTAPVGSALTRPAFPEPAPGAGPDPVRPGVAAPGPSGPGGSPAIDVDRLTDQIVTRLDDRLVAHRERMGRVF